MQGPSWVDVFRRIPANMQDTLVMLTATGAEIMIQKILVMEADYFVVRGRMSGSQDGGLVIILPYDQISNIAFNRRMLEPEVLQIFGSTGFVPAVAPVAAVAAAAGEAEAAAAPAAAASAAPAAAPTAAETADKPVEVQGEPAKAAPENKPPEPELPPRKPNPPSKTTLLARLRARLANSGKSDRPTG